ncbi:hypothetical protein [Ruegeria atlantica]|uniref:hypothetical protein n=1 Tax=Ruegeria atlantica TaxID=81569 RepID=UPI00147FE174|nr:hypothetical protein [Ruegeria atlantica]
MKTVIHIGSPKTGSTALQNALFNARDELTRHGVLYPNPSPELGKQVNHGLLAGAIRPYDIGPRPFRMHSEQEHNARVEAFLKRLSSQVSMHNPDLLILSSEYLWAVGRKQAWLSKLHDLLKHIGVGSVEFVGYVRGPSSFYLSQIQQQLRASSRFRLPKEHTVTNNLDGYSQFFSDSKVSARLFDREALVGGDIITDFLSLYRPDLQQSVLRTANNKSTNESLSAEGMALIQLFRRHFYSDRDDQFNKPTRKFIKRLRSIEKKFDFPRPKLHPEIAEYLDYAGTGPLELRDRYGIVFPKLDYSRLEREEFANKPQVGGAVQDVVQVDEERLEQMVHSLLQSNHTFNPALKTWLRSLPQGKTAPSAFSLTLRNLRRFGN